MVEISSDDDLVEMSVAASPELSSVSVFTPTKWQPSPTSSRCGISYVMLLRQLFISIYPTKGNIKYPGSRRHSAYIHESA